MGGEPGTTESRQRLTRQSLTGWRPPIGVPRKASHTTGAHPPRPGTDCPHAVHRGSRNGGSKIRFSVHAGCPG